MMKIKIHLLILFAFFSDVSFAQAPCPEDLRPIYTAVLNDYCQDKTWSFVMEDSAKNKEIYRWRHDRYLEALDLSWMHNKPPFPVDSAWIPFLLALEPKINSVKKIRMPFFESIARVVVLDKDSIIARSEGGEAGRGVLKGFGWMNAQIELSDVLLSDNGSMAIVEFSQHCGNLCGSGYLALLQKDRFNQWKVVYKIPTWIS